MAITKAQQARQMLIKGGVVHSDGRLGFFVGAERDARQGRGDMSPGTDREGNQRPGPNNPRRGGAGTAAKRIEKYKQSRKLKGPPSQPQIDRFKLAERNKQKAKEEKEKKEREEKIAKEEARKQRLQLGVDSTTKFGTPFSPKFGTPVGPMSPRQRNIFDLQKIELAKSAIEDDEEDEKRVKEIAEQNPLEKFLGNFKPPSVALIEGILDNIPGKSLREMYDIYGGDYKTFDDYQRDVLAGKISTKGGPMGGFFRDGQGNLIGGREGPDNQIIPQVVPTTTAPTTTATTSDEDIDDINRGLAARFAGSLFDFSSLADGGRVPAMGGGIMNTNVIGGLADGSMDQMGRQMYGLGKLVKSVTRGIKKVAKSPIGKAVLLNFAPALIPGGASTFFGGSKAMFGLPSFLSKKGLSDFFLKEGAKKFTLGNLSQRGLLTGLAGISALPFLFKGEEEEEQDLYRGPSIDIPRIRNNPYAFTAPRFEGSQFAADGGRIGYDTAGAVMSEEDMKKLAKSPLYKGFKKLYGADPSMAKDNPAYDEKFDTFEKLYKEGFQKGGNVEPVAKKTMPLIDMDGMEKDYRETGGFVEMGRMERADDVPARLSKNEFVFTADAVRNAGEGDIDKGAEVMYNMMKNLESGGEVSEESQGLEGARKMFQTSQRLGEVI